MITFQEILRRLTQYWEEQGCIVHQGYDLEVGAGTMNPATFLRCLGKEPYRAAYIEPCRRPADGRYGENPNRLQHYFQYQVILKPSPLDMQNLYIGSLEAIGFDLSQHDIRFIHDDWENPTIGAWGLGWEVWMDGMEVTQYTYFQSVGGIPVDPVTGELTYGIERLAMYLQNVDSIFDLKWNDHLSYGDIYYKNEVEWSHYNFEEATTKMWFDHFNAYEKEATKLIKKGLPIPAYEFVMKSSHAFNILDARGAISVTERTGYIGRIRDLAKGIAETYIASREALGFPLSDKFPKLTHSELSVPSLDESLQTLDSTDVDDYILEIGSEELPATFVPIGMANLKKDLTKLLEKEGITYKEITVYGTPRRLVAKVSGLAKAVPEKRIERRGPTVDKAFDSEGLVTPAGRGFFRGVGLEVSSKNDIDSIPELTIRELKGSDYVFAESVTKGRSTATILQEELPKLIVSLDFPKKMRWSDLSLSYARPLRWVVSLFGQQVVPFVVGDVLADRISRGHNQLDRVEVSIESTDNYFDALREHKVMCDPEERKSLITAQLDSLESKLGAKVISRKEVLPQVIHMVEWPAIAEATFDTRFLKVPKEVLISEMVKHQKYFPVAGPDGELLHHFVITADTTPTDQIRQGNQKVLSSRLADGVFLYEKGLKTKLDNNNEKLKAVTYMSDLGSMYDKVIRLQGHAEGLQRILGISSYNKVTRAAELSKADLVTEMVFEFPDLQGVIGRRYAEAQGEDKEVASAIEEQWMPLGENAPLPKTETGIILSLSDKFDNLISCFAAGFRPTSSSDPYALRRQALGIIRILINDKVHLPFRETLVMCCRNFVPSHLKNQQVVIDEIEEFFINRIKTVFQDYGFSKDEIDASVAHGFVDIYDTFLRVEALHSFRKSGEKFPRLYEVYKRAKGQINNQKKHALSESLLQEEAEKELYNTLSQSQKNFGTALKVHHYDQAYQVIAGMQQPLARLFDEVHILADDEGVRHNRIALLQEVFDLFDQLIDFSKIKEK